MDSRVIKRFLGYLIWGIAWTTVLTSIIAGMIWLSLTISGSMQMFPLIVVIVSVGSFGIYMLWRHATHEVKQEDYYNLTKGRKNGRSSN